MAQVGSLYTSLTLESSSFVSNMKKAADSAERGAGSIERALDGVKTAAAGFLAALSVDQVVRVVNRGLEYAASLGEVSQQLGVTTRDLQVFRYAATQVGISQEMMDRSLARLTRTLGEAKTGSKGATAAFEAVGISQREIAQLDTGEAIKRIADGLANVSDPAERAALQVDLFGRSGQQLETLLAGGRSAIDDLAGAADRLGVVLSDEAIQNADRTADKLSDLRMVMDANIAATVAENADAILYLGEAIGKLAGRLARGIAGDLRRFRSDIESMQDYFRGAVDIQQRDGVLAGWATYFNPGKARARGAQLRMLDTAVEDARGLLAPSAPAPAGLDGAPDPARTGGGRRRATGGGTAQRPKSLAELRMEGTEGTSLGFLGLPTVANMDAGIRTTFDDLDGTLQSSLKSLVDMDKIAGQIDASKFANAMEEASRWGDKLTSNLAQAIVYGQDFGTAMLNSLQAIAAEMVATGLKELLLGSDGRSGIIGSIVGSVIGGRRASGGPVQPGLAYVVGERGPELFSPSAAGSIIPNGVAMGGSGVTINFNGPVSNGRQVRLAASQAAARLARAAGAGRRGL